MQGPNRSRLWTPPWRGPPLGVQEDFSRKTPVKLGGAGSVSWSWNRLSGPKRCTRASELSQGGLGVCAQTVAPVTRLQKSDRRWIDGCKNITKLDSALLRIARDCCRPNIEEEKNVFEN